MDKISVNNQIISMRKFVKQGRLRLINKLVKDSKALSNKKGTDPQVEKYERKSNKLLAEIEILKKTNVDSVSKMALLKNKNWDAIIADKTSTLNDRAIALLANCEAVQKAVNNFHKSNPKVVPNLNEFLKAWEAKKTTEKKFTKATKASDFRKNKKGKTTNYSEQRNSNQRQTRNTSFGNRYNNSNNVLLGVKRETNPFPANSDEAVEIPITSSNRETNSVHEGNSSQIQKVVLPFAKLQDEALKSDIEDEMNSDNKAQRHRPEIPFKKEKDPFFITDDTPISSDEESKNEMEPLNSRDSSKRNTNFQRQPKQNFGNRDRFNTNERDGRSFGKKFQDGRFDNKRQFLAKKSSEGNNFKNKFPRSNNNQGYNQSQNSDRKTQKDFGSKSNLKKPPDEKLHPSWEAKKKLKTKSILPFQGTKIVFDT